MAKYPYLKSTTDPIGALEQLAAAVTMDPDEDSALAGGSSWFGRLLLEDGFKWSYSVDGQVVAVFTDRDAFANAYLSKEFQYTAYDWECTFLRVHGDRGEVQGEVEIKGVSRLTPEEPNHNGRHQFEYLLRKGDDGKWKIQECALNRFAGDERRPPIFQII